MRIYKEKDRFFPHKKAQKAAMKSVVLHGGYVRAGGSRPGLASAVLRSAWRTAHSLRPGLAFPRGKSIGEACVSGTAQSRICMPRAGLRPRSPGARGSVAAAATAAAPAVSRAAAAATAVVSGAQATAVIAEQADEDQDDDPGIAATKAVHLSFLLSLVTLP